MNYRAITRRIRRCESEVPAQVVLEYAINEAVKAERKACAKYVGEIDKDLAQNILCGFHQQGYPPDHCEDILDMVEKGENDGNLPSNL